MTTGLAKMPNKNHQPDAGHLLFFNPNLLAATGYSGVGPAAILDKAINCFC